MNTHDLIYFVRLVQLKNFSKVAQNMNVSQPTVSMALKRLESHFHTQLIHRNQNHHVNNYSRWPAVVSLCPFY